MISFVTSAAREATSPGEPAAATESQRQGKNMEDERMLDKLDRAAFAEHLNTAFRAQTDSGDAFELELREVTGDEREVAGGRQERFSLSFGGPADRLFPQGLYRLEHERLGTLDLFLVPLGKSRDGGFLYEAVFNRMIKQGDGS